jgi:hypothetical protein
VSFISIIDKTVIIYFGDSVANRHNETIDEMKKIINSGFKTFIFDFSGIKVGFSSYMVGLVIALVKTVNEEDVVFQNISPSDIDVLNTAGLSLLIGKR